VISPVLNNLPNTEGTTVFSFYDYRWPSNANPFASVGRFAPLGHRFCLQATGSKQCYGEVSMALLYIGSAKYLSTVISNFSAEKLEQD
jgi:hypothetical protein